MNDVRRRRSSRLPARAPESSVAVTSRPSRRDGVAVYRAGGPSVTWKSSATTGEATGRFDTPRPPPTIPVAHLLRVAGRGRRDRESFRGGRWSIAGARRRGSSARWSSTRLLESRGSGAARQRGEPGDRDRAPHDRGLERGIHRAYPEVAGLLLSLAMAGGSEPRVVTSAPAAMASQPTLQPAAEPIRACPSPSLGPHARLGYELARASRGRERRGRACARSQDRGGRNG